MDADLDLHRLDHLANCRSNLIIASARQASQEQKDRAADFSRLTAPGGEAKPANARSRRCLQQPGPPQGNRTGKFSCLMQDTIAQTRRIGRSGGTEGPRRLGEGDEYEKSTASLCGARSCAIIKAASFGCAIAAQCPQADQHGQHRHDRPGKTRGTTLASKADRAAR
jgi:hypothetical protein